MSYKTASAQIARCGIKVAEQQSAELQDLAVRLFKTAAAVERGCSVAQAVDTFFPDDCKCEVMDELYKVAFDWNNFNMLNPSSWFQWKSTPPPPPATPNWLQNLVGDKAYKDWKLDKAYNRGSKLIESTRNQGKNLINNANAGLAKSQFVQNRIAGLGKDIRMMQGGNVIGGGGRILGKAAIPLLALYALNKLRVKGQDWMEDNFWHGNADRRFRNDWEQRRRQY
jgi:hypothetical protein